MGQWAIDKVQWAIGSMQNQKPVMDKNPNREIGHGPSTIDFFVSGSRNQVKSKPVKPAIDHRLFHTRVQEPGENSNP
jgi:hypothetical protein